MREREFQSTTWGQRSGRGSRVVRNDAASRHHRHHIGLIIVLLYLLVSTGVAMATVHVMHGRSDPLSFFGSTRDPVAPPKYLVLMVLDGARPDYFGLTPLRHVDALRAQGTQYTNAFDGILESETPAGHSTIATGSTPARNGILGFEWAQSDNDYSLFDPNVVRSGAMEHIMEQEGVPTIASLYKARYPKARVVALSGHKYYAADPLGGPAADAIMYYQGDPQGRYVPVSIPGHSPPAGVLNAPGVIAPNTRLADGAEDSLATKLALAAFAKMHQRITLINYPEFDWPVGHVDGGNQDPAKVIQLMKAFDRDLGKIEDAYSKAGVLKQTLFVITADHGMAPLKRFIPSSIISDAVQQAGTTAPAVSNSTGAYVWLADTSKAQLVAQNIVKAADPSIQSVYYLTTSGGQTQYALAGGSFVRSEVDKTNQYLLGTLVNGHEPTVVVFAKENASFADPSTNWKADHGGASWQSQHIPLILAGPGIRPAVVTGQPAQLDDLAPTILTDMGAKTTGMQGNVLTDALLSSKVQVQRVRSAEVKLLTPMVNAMIAQDNYESSAR